MPTHSLWCRPIVGGAYTDYPGGIQDFALSEDYLFFTTQTDEGIFVCSLRGGVSAGGTQMQKITPKQFFWLDGWLYYSSKTEENSNGQPGWWTSVWRCREDGSNAEMLVEHTTGGFNAKDGWLYYNRSSAPQTQDVRYPPGVLERKSLSTGEVQVLDAAECARGGIALAGDWVVFQANVKSTPSGENVSPQDLYYASIDTHVCQAID